MKPSVYLETSFLSYAAAQFNDNLIVLARIRSSQDWWSHHRKAFELCVCQTVVDECLKGRSDAIHRRTQLLAETTLLPITSEVSKLALQLIERGIVPVKVGDDAVHIACAAVHGCDFLLTWNFRHIHNPFQSRPIRETIEEYGFQSPVICTPDIFLGG